ncbi:MAG: HDOD domain-containing protein [Verrucomicrobiota bacterium]|jgi:HD-like signal output (HDOD) protein
MKRTIYIVDDQSEVLETAVVIVRGLVPDSEVTGFAGPHEALAAVRAKPPDVILSDQLMPRMQGSQLLEEVRTLAPGAVRIIMSGYVAMDRLNVITSAHQYVAKPFDALQLKELLDRIFAAQQRIQDEGLKTVVTSLRSLPSLPQVRHTLLAELADSYGASATIGQTIAQDPGLSAKVLQLANSPLFGRSSLVTSPVEAVLCLGTTMITAVVLSQALFKHYNVLSHRESSLRRLWSHCWETASLGQIYCREQGLPHAAGEEAFLGGLLHETGRLILIDNFPDRFQAACDAARRDGSPLGPALRHTFQTTPAQIAAYLLDLWGMPSNVVAAVSLLDRPQDEKASKFTLASALYIADQVASRKSSPDAFPPAEWDAEYVRSVGGDGDIGAWQRNEVEGVRRPG